MPIVIFQSETGDEGLEVTDDGAVTYYIKRSSPSMIPGGPEPRDQIMSAEQAKLKWKSFAPDIDRALVNIAANQIQEP